MLTSKNRNLFSKHIKYIAVVAALWFGYIISGIGCPIYSVLGVRCPTCGVTRALLGLLTGNLERYFHMQPFALPLINAVIVAIHLSVIPYNWKSFGMFFVIVTVILNFGWYINSFL